MKYAYTHNTKLGELNKNFLILKAKGNQAVANATIQNYY